MRRALAFVMVAAIASCHREAPVGPARPPPLASAASAPSPRVLAPTPTGPLPSPPPLPEDGRFSEMDALIARGIARGDAPGAVVVVIDRGAVVHAKAFGLRSVRPEREPMTLDTIFDLASLTKPLATAAATMLLVEDGKLRLTDRVAQHLPSFAQRGKGEITLEELLLHTSGLAADDPLGDYEGGAERAWARIDAMPLVSPPGTAHLYSDVGYIVLGRVIERVAGAPLTQLTRARLFGPLGMTDTAFLPAAELAPRIAPTETREGRMLRGEVHDPRAHLLGGVAGHAGLFATAADVARFVQMLLASGEASGRRVLRSDSVRSMLTPRPIPGGARSLAFDASPRATRGGVAPGLGHTGFTGTSLWLDPAKGRGVVLLTSRLHPDGKGDVRQLRLDVVPAALDALEVLPGIDVLERHAFRELRGLRVALLTNRSGVDRAGRSTASLLAHADGVRLVKLFSPEHGLRGDAEGPVADGRDPETALPVESLYGAHEKPSPEQLRGLDALLVDLADVGVRFFTYETTLGYALEAAAKARVRVVVLDRPDPIGGVGLEGPSPDPGRASFTAFHRIPIRHGMTLGELARLFAGERHIDVELSIVRIEGWRRGDLQSATGLGWVDPSPNLRRLEAALAYPGLALLETTNLSVGRGTPRPFEQFGAPYVDGERLADALRREQLEGVVFTPTRFRPASSTFAGEVCRGVALAITDPRAFRPVRAGIALARALASLYPTAWRPAGMPLLAHAATLAAILRGDSLDTIEALWAEDLEAFRATRAHYLLY